jgi:DNA-binding winged helix-turn-helix (wHTH) protein
MAERPAARASLSPSPVRARFERFELDEANACLLRDGKAISLAPTPFAVLCALVRQPGTLLTKNALLDQVWGHQFVSESVLKTVISELRTTLKDDARQPRFIETVSRRGYRFVAPDSGHVADPGERSKNWLADRAIVHRPRRSALATSHSLGSCVHGETHGRLGRR